jgi:hypothetical protein
VEPETDVIDTAAGAVSLIVTQPEPLGPVSGQGSGVCSWRGRGALVARVAQRTVLGHHHPRTRRFRSPQAPPPYRSFGGIGPDVADAVLRTSGAARGSASCARGPIARDSKSDAAGEVSQAEAGRDIPFRGYVAYPRWAVTRGRRSARAVQPKGLRCFRIDHVHDVTELAWSARHTRSPGSTKRR